MNIISFPKYPSLSTSLLKMVKRNLGITICEVCGKSGKDFSSKKHFVEHFQAVCHSAKRYQCDKCNLGFQFEKGLKEHKSTKHESISFKCEYCDKDFITKRNLERHIGQIHQSMSSVSCIKCRKEFPHYVKNNFNQHFESCRGRSFEKSRKKSKLLKGINHQNTYNLF